MKTWIKNTIQWGTVALMFAFPVGLAFYGDSEPAPFFNSPGIVGPDEAVIGEMVRLQIVGDDVEWKILPEIPDFQVFGQNNQNMVVSFREGGEYAVIAAVITADTELEIETLKIKVGNGKPPVVIPDDDTPVVVKPVFDERIVNTVAQWSAEASLPKDLASQLADRFDLVANEVDKGELATPAGVVARTKNLVSTLDLTSYATLLEKLQNLLTEEADAGRLSTQADHSHLWKSVAEGFRKHAAEALGGTQAIAVFGGN